MQGSSGGSSGGMSGNTGSGASGGSVTGSGGGMTLGSDLNISVASWKGNARGAYTIIHDDLCNWDSSSLENGKASGLLAARGLTAAFGAIVRSCSEQNLWSVLRTLRDAGHEVINHSWDHTDHVCARNLALQVNQAHDALTQNLSTPSFYIFPFDSYDDTALNHLRGLGYLGARGGRKGLINTADYPDDFKLNFDVFGPGYSYYCDQGQCSSETLVCRKAYTDGCEPTGPVATNQGSEQCRLSILRQYVDDAIAQGGWAIREFHGVADNHWEPVPESTYTAHLDYVKLKVEAAELWADNPTPIIKYRRSRQHCTTSVQDKTLSFVGPSAECLKYAVPLTFVVRPATGSAPSTLSATQGGMTIQGTKRGTEFVIELDPTRGDAVFSWL
jgi:peptidoglycan/xylan/chitin deacetylase (PgdA/CDA1 family)